MRRFFVHGFALAIFLLALPLSAYSEEPRHRDFTQAEIEEMERSKAIIHTGFGDIKLKFFPEVAPNHVDNFIQLSKSGFYDGTTFHRLVPGFVIQGGDPNGDGSGGPGYTLKAEFNDKEHRRGILSMARAQDPDSAGSQFFICLADALFLDGQYTVFGEVVKGMEAVDAMVAQSYLSRESPAEPIEITVDIIESGAYAYYVPYFISDSDHWTGGSLRNSRQSETASVTIEVYGRTGSRLLSQAKTLAGRGQDTFTVGAGSGSEGWILIDSDQPLTGFFGFGTTDSGCDSYAADMTLNYTAATRLFVPNAVNNSQWDTTVFVCNPNESSTSVSLNYVNPGGEVLYETSVSLSPMGSGEISIKDLVQETIQDGGSVEIAATQPVAAFALYDNIKSGGRSYLGLSAVRSDDQ